ncbi:MAG: hypothetical protein KDB68_17675 [Planctomycetes bacterium]|nr:hypothetical protein [Planctomycetota bacterium]
MSEPETEPKAEPFLIWHIAEGSPPDSELQEVEESLAKKLRELKLPFRPFRIGTGFENNATVVDLGKPDAKSSALDSRVCIVLLHGDESFVGRCLDIAPNTVRGDVATILTAIETVFDVAPRVRQFVLAPVTSHLGDETLRSFERAAHERADSATHQEWAKDIKLITHRDAVPKYFVELDAENVRQRIGKRFALRTVLLVSFFFFVLGNWMGRNSSQQEPTEVIRPVPIVETVSVERAADAPNAEDALFRTASLFYSGDVSGYTCTQIGSDHRGSYWLCPIPLSWRDTPTAWRETPDYFLPAHWRNPKLVGFRVTASERSAAIEDASVIAAVGKYLVLYVKSVGRVAEGQVAHASLARFSRQEVKIAFPNSDEARALQSLFPELATGANESD